MPSTKKINDTFVYKVIRNRKTNKEAYDVFVRLAYNVKEKKVTMSDYIQEVLLTTLDRDRQSYLPFNQEVAEINEKGVLRD